MNERRTGFEGDSFEDDPIYGMLEGIVVNRTDPLLRGRVKVRIPGVIETESAWARPSGGGSRNWGHVSVPPLNATVDVWFVRGDINDPKYLPGDFGADANGVSEMFPEHEDPDVHVFGFGPFRLVVDLREGQQVARWKVVKTVGQAEEDLAYFELNADDLSAFMFAESAAGIKGNAITDVDSEGDVQIKGRKVMPKRDPIN